MLSLVKECRTFLEEHEGKIILEHLDQFLQWLQVLEKGEPYVEVKSKHGTHNNTCIWSKETCMEGPDTCACFYYQEAYQRLRKLMDLYKRAFRS